MHCKRSPCKCDWILNYLFSSCAVQASLETELEFQLVGIILGLAIYNNVILDCKLPVVTYKASEGCCLNIAKKSQVVF